MSNYDYDWYYKILSTLNQWNQDPQRIKDGGLVDKDFVYASGANPEWMTIDLLRDFLHSLDYRELQILIEE